MQLQGKCTNLSGSKFAELNHWRPQADQFVLVELLRKGDFSLSQNPILVGNQSLPQLTYVIDISLIAEKLLFIDAESPYCFNAIQIFINYVHLNRHFFLIKRQSGGFKFATQKQGYVGLYTNKMSLPLSAQHTKKFQKKKNVVLYLYDLRLPTGRL